MKEWGARALASPRLVLLQGTSWRGCLGGLWSYARSSWLNLCLGAIVCWLGLNALAQPGVVITDQVEAIGPQFANPDTLDIVTTVHRNRVCPTETQRFVWRRLNANNLPWHDGDGAWHEQAIPLLATVNPFLADSETLVLTLPSRDIPDRETGGWMFRSVTTERCGILPVQFAQWFGTRIFRSRDVPVNFVGAPRPSNGAKP